MTIAPIVQAVTVAVPPERAFAIFAGDIGRWWKPGTHIGKTPMADIVMEPHPGGRWFERDAAGVETDWGRVIAWDPPERLLLAWLIDASFAYNPGCESHVEVTFAPADEGTLVTLTHSRLEVFGPSAEIMRGRLSGGWPTLIGGYRDYIGSAAALDQRIL
jgi:uncharacterized protein YndB with AHSA1/START domain